MRLCFDHGTLVVTEPPDFPLDFAPGLVWDDRLALWRAPAHRYPEVVAAFDNRGVAFRDQVLALGQPPESWRSVPLRPYQEAALKAWELGGRAGVVVLPTGAGKTRVALAAMARSAARTLCLVPTRALLRQWRGELGRFYPGPVGCLGDGEHEVQPVTVATFESAYRHMPKLGCRFELLVVDEVHHFGGGQRDEALETAAAIDRLGLTATPPDHRALTRLETLVGPVVFRLGLGDLAGRWLSDFDLVVLWLSLDSDEHARYTADHRQFQKVHRAFRKLHPSASWQDFVAAASQSPEGRAALNAWRRARRLLSYTGAKERAVDRLLRRHRGSRVLIFTADNDAAYAIARQHLVMPITCEIGRRERDWALDAFREGRLTALVSARVLNEGIDVPEADVAIIVGSTLGQREHVQRIGRLLRPVPGKRATVYELVTFATAEARQASERRLGLAASHLLSA